MAEIWVKLESANPTGSYKDRMALAMIEGAERDGRLAPGQTVVEYTGGSTGSSLAYVCGLKGYPLRIVTSDAFAEEKLKTMRALGADVEIVPSPDGITPDLIPRMIERSKKIVDEVGGFATDQFRNRDMLDGYASLARELLEQLDGRLDAFCAYIGTSGCFVGVTRELRRTLPGLRRVAIEPAESPVISGGEPGTHGSKAAVLVSGRRSSNATTSMRYGRSPRTTRLRWHAGRRGRRVSGPGHRLARTSWLRLPSRGSLGLGSASRCRSSTPGSSTWAGTSTPETCVTAGPSSQRARRRQPLPCSESGSRSSFLSYARNSTSR